MLGLANRMSLSLGSAINGGGVAIAARNFTTIDAANVPSLPIPNISLTGDFVLFDSINTVSSLDQATKSGGTAAGKLEISMNTSGFILVDVAGVNIITGTIAVNDAKNHVIQVARVGTTATLYIDGVSDGSGTMSGTVEFDTLAARSGGGLEWTGTIWNTQVYDAGVLVRNYAINEDWVNTRALVNSVAALGPELVSSTPGDWSTANATVTIVDGRIRVTNTTASQGTAALTLGVPSETVLGFIGGMTSSGSGGEAWFNSPFGSLVAFEDLFTTHTFTGASEITIRSNGTNIGDWVEYDLPSVKQADGYGQAINIDSDDAELFTKSGIDWLGVDVANVNPDSLDSGWLQTDVKNYYTNGTNVANARTFFNSLVETGLTYRAEAELTNFVSGSFIFNTSDGSSPTLTSNGTLVWDFMNTTNNSLRLRAPIANSEYDICLKSVRRLLEGA